MYKLLHKMFGAYTLAVPAKDGVRLVNILNRAKILFWGIKTDGENFYIKASLFSCEAVIRTAAAEGITAEIVKTMGLPFIFSKYKGRYGLILGSIAGLILIFYSQLFIWEVNISGNKEIKEDVIISALEKHGVKRGAFIPDLNVVTAEQDFLRENKEISSISVNIKGTYAQIALLERTYPPDIVDTLGYYNIVASHDGIIVKVEAADGFPEVKAGDIVVEGQLLINSFIPGKFENYRLTHARGEVYAEVTEKYSISIPLEQTEKIYTGKTEDIKTMTVMGHFYNFLAKDKPSFEYYDIDVLQWEKKLFGIIKTPVIVTEARYTEYIINKYSITEEAAKARAAEAFSQYLDRLEEEIKKYDCDGYYDKENNAYIFNASVVVIKNIAVEKPIELID